jgi:hypothetical protein
LYAYYIAIGFGISGFTKKLFLLVNYFEKKKTLNNSFHVFLVK